MRNLMVAACLCAPCLAIAQLEQIQRSPLQFGVIVDGRCAPDDALTKEATILGSLAAEVGAKTLLSVVQTALEEFAQDRSVTRVGTGAGALYRQDKDGRLDFRVDARCITFWYGKRGSEVVQTDTDAAIQTLVQSLNVGWTSKDRPLLRAWAELNFAEIPYLYGQVAVSATADGSAVLLQPRRYFARPAPDLQRTWGPAPVYAATVELSDVGQDKPFAVHGVGLQSPLDGPLVMSPDDMTGMRSGWFPGPRIDAPPKDKPATTGRFSVKVMLTATQPGSRLAKALGGTLKDSNEAIVKALTPKLSSEKTGAREVAIEAAFDAEVAVAEAQRDLDAADAANKPALEVKVRKAKFVANAKRSAAGLAPKYDIQP